MKKLKISPTLFTTISLMLIFLLINCITINISDKYSKKENISKHSNTLLSNGSENKINDVPKTPEKTIEEKRKEISDKYGYETRDIEYILSNYIYNVDGKKVAFLTFDDGPSTTNTPKVLDILDEKDVKATFFVLGNEIERSEESKTIFNEIYQRGHAIGNHSYSHDYNYLYPNRHVNTDHILEDFTHSENVMKSVLGNNFKCNVVRFPGGHMSWDGMKASEQFFIDHNMKYIDWNCLTGDSEIKNATKDQLLANFHATYKNQDRLVVLMHDTYGKESTVEALPEIIDFLRSEGYEFGILI